MVATLLLALILAPSPAPSGDVAALSWMAGTWTGTEKGTEAEEVWTSPRGGTLLGLHRDVAQGRTVSFEFLRIEAGRDGLIYWGSPGGKPATPFRMIEQSRGRVVFENKEHDFPTRILYWMGEDGRLHARIEGLLQGKLAGEEWSWKKAS